MYMQFDSDDEREAAEAKVAREHTLRSQSTKKAMKNRAQLPRTAGLRTLSELTTEMTKAGLDPSRIQERAQRIAKVQGAKRKRQREEEEEEEDAEMDVDEGRDDMADGEGEWMDVDGEDATPHKRAKGNSGAVIAKGSREPRSNRQLAGMRDEAVRLVFLSFCSKVRKTNALWFLLSYLASSEGAQAAESWPEGTQLPGESW